MNVPQLVTSLVVIAVIFHVLLIGVAYGIFLERKIAAWAQDRIGPNRVGFGGLLRPVVNLLLFLPLWPLKKLGFCQDIDPDNMWRTPTGQAIYNHHNWGFGQAIADGVKFVGKEDYNPGNVDKTLFILAPMLAVLPAAVGWAVVPWGGTWQFPGGSLFGFEWETTVVHFAVANLNIGIVYLLAIGSLAVYGVTVGAWAANNKYTFLGGIRATAQMLSYEIPMGLCVLAVLLLVGTANPGDIVARQADYAYGIIPQWLALQQPLACILFFVCILAESNRAPFDLAECEQELIGGFHTEYSSMKFALFFLGEYMHMMTGCAFLTLLFLGGWHLPYVDYLLYGVDTGQTVIGYDPVTGGGLFGILAGFGIPASLIGLLGVIIKVKVFLLKVLILLAIMMWVRWTLPRFRFDQLMKLAWRSLIPLTLLILITTGTFVYLGWQDYMWLGNIVILFVALGVAPLIPQGPPVNRRVPLPGSRFSPLPSE